MAPTITDVEVIEYSYQIDDVGLPSEGRKLPIYDPGNTLERTRFGVRVQTDTGVSGGCLSFLGRIGMAQISLVANKLIGRNPLRRERLWADMKSSLSRSSKVGVGPLDIALWDFAGKYHNAPIHELLGTYRTELPTYATTLFADDNGGLDSAEAYADFAEECLEYDYHGYKIHGFETPWNDEKELAHRNVDVVTTVGEQVGNRMDLMLDSGSKYDTWARALEVGEALDEYDYFWYEDPYGNGEGLQQGHRRLRERLDTPILQGEVFNGIETFTDHVAAGAVDMLHIDPEVHCGITGTMKIASAAEGNGIDVQIHGPGPARRHCIASIRNTHYYEIAAVHPDCENPVKNPAYAGAYSDDFDTLSPDGTVPVPDGPGLGIDIDWDYIEDNAVRREHFE